MNTISSETRLQIANWMDIQGQHEDAFTQRAIVENKKTKLLGRWAIGPFTYSRILPELVQSQTRKWITKTTCTTVHTFRGIPGGDVDIWIDDRIINPTTPEEKALADGNTPEGFQTVRMALELFDKIGCFAGRRPSLTIRLFPREQWLGLPLATLLVARNGKTMKLTINDVFDVPQWEGAFRSQLRIISDRQEAGRIFMWHWSKYYNFIPREIAESSAGAFSSTLPEEGKDLNEMNREASRELYALARCEGWRKLTLREQKKYGVIGQWHRVSELESRVIQETHNPSGCGDATIRASNGIPTQFNGDAE